ncbi:hypothetical protein TOPH_06669 [Tolypocladium ophioglossoides CBS 100239]|uniref:Uncharacterized protein n=1 Tax=Tolypocladium ophioglossoides (strain CBS 100239) TaxID=1163406 RepID=A0A0L0N446_TOLOC|nr:hypothetical protein TOPH_06669 [Tolypocladium ophioglossoides CBS 100239]
MAVTAYLFERTQAVTMTTTAKPLPGRHASSSFFQLSAANKRIRSRVQEQLQREKAALQEEAMLRGQAWLYLNDFLRHSPWEDQMDQIAIVRDAVPTMPELNSYGDLDEKEGTMACRRLFKAVVVWDELGHTLWKTLRAASEQRQLVQRQFELAAALDRCPGSGLFVGSSYRSSRRSSEASEASVDSVDSLRSRDSAHSSVCEKKPQRRQQQPALLKLSKKLSSSSSRRSSSETSESGREHSCSRCGTNHSRSAIPKMISHNCVSAVRRTLSALGGAVPA